MAHRRRIKHYNEPGHAHLLTFSCYQGLPLLRNDTVKPWLSLSIDRATKGHAFDLITFVYMPEHVHLLVYPRRDDYSISALLYAIKRPFSSRVKRYLELRRSPWLARLTVRERRRKTVFRFWQKGPGHDRNLTSGDDLFGVADYLHHNPVRRGLVPSPDLWKWSSWRFYDEPEAPLEEGLPRIDGFPER